MRRGNALRGLFRERWFPTLLTTRLVSQTGDGIFQASLASAVFFNPDHQTDPHRAATGFVVLLLPYSLVSPFAGVLLDRWRRQRVLVRANLVRPMFVLATAALLATSGARGVAFYVAALAALSVNRFYLSALSASLPHIVASRRLVLGNSVTTTSGTIATLVGLGIGVAVRSGVGKGDRSSALIAAASVVAYLAASAVATRMPASLLGPDTDAIALRQALRGVVRGFASGARHVWTRKAVIAVLSAMAVGRFLFGLSTIGTLLLYRNYFHDHGALRAGLVGLGQALTASGIGYGVAAVLTPALADRFGKPRIVAATLVIAGVSGVALGLPFAMAPLLAGALIVGFTTQAVKICTDTTVQEDVEDDYRGRVFAVYDTLFNLTFVVAAVVAAFILPTTGKSYVVLVAIGLGYVTTGVGYALAQRRVSREVREVPAPAAT